MDQTMTKKSRGSGLSGQLAVADYMPVWKQAGYFTQPTEAIPGQRCGRYAVIRVTPPGMPAMGVNACIP